jgi:hypothetical protein
MKTGPRTTHGPKDIIRARRDGHVVRIPKPVLVIDDPELAEEFVAHLLTKFYVCRWLQTAGLGDHFQDSDAEGMLREESVQGRSQPDRQ